MMRWCGWWWILLVLVMPVRGADGPAADAVPTGEAKAPPCFVIPSAEELGGSEEISNYRQQFEPTLYQPEWSGWPVLDLIMLAVLLLLGGVMVWRHVHFRWFWLPAALTLLYFGVVRGGCICPVGSVGNMSIGLAHPERIGVFTALMVLLPLVVALFMGRVFCVAGCPLGAVQHLLGGRRSIRLPSRLEGVLRWFPVLTLLAAAWLAVRGTCMLVCLLDPYKTAFFFGYGWVNRMINWFQGGLVEPGWFWVGSLTAWGILAVSLLAGIWVYRPFCRFVCPYGVLLGLFSMVAFKRRQIEQSQCVQCGLCENRCPVNAIKRDPRTKEFAISSFHCIQCNRCSSLCRKKGVF
ncbi:MAG: 4Fe-4S binding protein [Akkermansiaceae bacterium]|nr:4Fe-4S binding protein [Akkermansiaceae bacterium]